MSGHDARSPRPSAPPTPPGPPRSVREVLAAADLPDPLTSLVRETVRRTRLRRAERIEIARELVAHFEAGIDAGGEPARLAREFGEPRTAAPLLRSAARRRRGPVDRALGHVLRWSGAGAAIVVLAYAAAAIRLASLEPTVRFDAVARLQQMTPSAAAAEAAWPRYREALAWHRSWANDDATESAPATKGSETPNGPGFGRNRVVEATAGEPPDTAFDAILDDSSDPEERRRDAATLRARADEMRALRVAAGMPALGWTHDLELSEADRAWFGGEPEPQADFPADAIVNLPIPYLGVLRDAARLLAADARLALEAGDGDRAVASLEAIVGVAGHVGEAPILINQIVESDLVALAADEIVRAVSGSPGGRARIGDAGLERLAGALRRIPETTWLLDLAGERLWFDDLVQRLYSDDGDGGGVLLAEAVGEVRLLALLSHGRDLDAEPPPALVAASAPAVAALAAGRRETLALGHRLYDLIESETRLPIDERPRQADREIEAIVSRPGLVVRHPVVAAVVPAISRTADRLTTARMRVEAAMVAIAVEQWRRERGSWPGTLSVLVPERLDRVPRDAWTGEPLRYAVTPDGPRLWSVGPDGHDDGGRHVDPLFLSPDREGDVVLMPPGG